MTKPCHQHLHQQMKDMDLSELLHAVRSARARTRRCVRVFLERVQDETVIAPEPVLPLLIEGPDYVMRAKSALGKDFPDYRLRSIAVLASGLNAAGAGVMAEDAFQGAHEVAVSDPFEMAALACREAVFEAGRGNHAQGRQLADEAVEIFEQDNGKPRDDRSLAFALMVRAAVIGWQTVHGEAADLKDAYADYQRSLLVSKRWMKRTRDAAIIGLNAASAVSWLTDTTAQLDPTEVIDSLTTFRCHLRREHVPVCSVIDARARWVLILALSQQQGILDAEALALAKSARAHLQVVGTTRDSFALSVDIQWCLVGEGRWQEALEEWSAVEDTLLDLPKHVQSAAILWGSALHNRQMTQKTVRQVYAVVRQLPMARLPGSRVPPGSELPGGYR